MQQITLLQNVLNISCSSALFVHHPFVLEEERHEDEDDVRASIQAAEAK